VTSATARPCTAAVTGLRNDAQVTIAIVVRWTLLALFVMYTSVMLRGRVFTDHGTFRHVIYHGRLSSSSYS
jgi:hypothetical protein